MDFNKLYQDNYNQVLRTAKAFLKHEEDAKDVAQDTFIKVYDSLDSYDPNYNVSTWITEICINKCKDKLRKRNRENKVFSVNNDKNEYLLDSMEDQTTPDMILSAAEDEAQLMSCFLNLPVNLSQALTLRFSDELTYKEIGERLKIPENTAKTWVRRGRKQLLQVI